MGEDNNYLFIESIQMSRGRRGEIIHKELRCGEYLQYQYTQIKGEME